jgi:eukaryotic-like serine/threonine-protein kinase
MTPERWQNVKNMLCAVLELEAEQRPAYLDRACASDPSLRGEVESLLDSGDDIRSSFLQSPPVADSPTTEGTADELSQ